MTVTVKRNCSEQYVFITATSENCGQPSNILVKELIFRKATSLVTLAVNYLRSIFHRFWLQFSVRFCSFVPGHLFFWTLPSICFFSKDTLSIKYLSNKLSYVHLLIKVFFEGKIIDYFECLFAEHTLYYKHIVRRGGKPPILRKRPISENSRPPTHPIST